ncbi:MAG: transcriptional repressor [Verrucomicrobiaceae bacterium]|nr:transcriptional repressor [Verrucomicrobiaceae bacterium]
MNLGDGHRMTPQRREVYEVLMENQDHPTATEVFMRVKERMPAISLATVYNCLDTLSGAGFIIQVNVDREPSRYCGNLSPHGHFHCEDCGTILDVRLKEGVQASGTVTLPRGAVAERFEVAVRGHCPECVRKRKPEVTKSS